MVLNSIEKVKPGSLLSSMCTFPELNGTKFWSHRFYLQNSGILQIRMDQKGDTPWKWILTFSKYKNEYRKELAQKVDEKNGVICLVFFFPSSVMVLKLTKIVHFLQICADLSQKSKSIKAIYLYPSETTHHALSENSMFYRGLNNSSRDNEISRNLMKFTIFQR